jgi:hypothetical protein
MEREAVGRGRCGSGASNNGGSAMTARHLPVITLEHTAHITMKQIAGVTSSDVQDAHHREWMAGNTPHTEAWHEAYQREAQALRARARNHEMSEADLKAQLSALAQRLTTPHYIHSLFVFAVKHAARMQDAEDLVEDYRRRKPRVVAK